MSRPPRSAGGRAGPRPAPPAVGPGRPSRRHGTPRRGRITAFTAALLAGALATGCAAVATQGTRPGDRPAEEARLIPEGGAICSTPCRIELALQPQEFELRIEVAGYQTGRVMIRRRGDTWQADITDLGRVPCLAIDVRNGNVYAAEFADIRRLRPVDAVTLGGGETGYLYAVVVSEPEPTWRQVTRLWGD